MFLIQHAVVSSEVADQYFVCDLLKCKGACCVEGDMGAPLDKEELPTITAIQEAVLPYLSEAGKAAIERQGPYVVDADGDFSTPIIEGMECAYAIYDAKGILKCGIEQAHLDGKIAYRKPISCHLYPIRIQSMAEGYEAVNYERWSICSDACQHGKALQVPLYKFLKEPLIRKFGTPWYDELCKEIHEQSI